MKKISKKLQAGLLALLLMLGVFGAGVVTAHAEETVADTVVETDTTVVEENVQEGNTEEVTEPEPEVQEYIYEMELFENQVQGDVYLSTEYEGATPKITFISPSGKEYSEDVSTEEEFLFTHGANGGWSNFKIVNAEPGMWSVRCVKSDEYEVVFFPVQMEEGVAIQEFTLLSLVGKEATVYFDVTKGDIEMPYRYSIGMISSAGEVIRADLVTGEGMTGTPQEITFYMDASSCTNAKLVLRVECDDNAGTFDSVISEEFVYENPDTPEALTGVTITLDETELLCTLDWSQYIPWGWGAYSYNVKVLADDNEAQPVYDEEGLTRTMASFFYPRGTKKLDISVAYTLDGILSKEYAKTIDLSSMDYLRYTGEDVTGEAMLPLEYSSKEAAQLTVTLNGQTGVYRIKGQDTIFFSLVEGNNELYATFIGADGITHVVEKDIYMSAVNPRITLFEELNGKTFRTTTATLSGMVENAAIFTVNGTEVAFDTDGTFSYAVPLEPGDNEVVLNAQTESGVGATMVLTLVRDGDEDVSDAPVVTPTPGDDEDPDGDGTDDGDKDVPAGTKPAKKDGFDWKKYAPLMASAGLFVVLLLIFLFVFRKKENKKFTGMIFVVLSVLLLVASGVVLGLAIYMHHRLRDFNNSLEYIELARQSLEKAANYLTYETEAKELVELFKYITIGFAFLVPIVILVRRKLVYGAFFKKKTATGEATKETAQETTDDVAEEIALEEVAEEEAETPETEEADAEDTAAATKEE